MKALDSLSRLMVFALLHANQGGAKVELPGYIAKVLCHFYEVEPLSSALEMLLRELPEQWPRLQTQLLTANNYVLRTAMARAMGKAYADFEPPTVTLTSITALLDSKDLNTFELGGYALLYVYSNRPNTIDPKMLEKLAIHPAYPGRSILGDLSINLALQDRKLRDLFDSERFWKPIWEHVALDVWMVQAIAVESGGAASDDSDGVRHALAHLSALKAETTAILQAGMEMPPAVVTLLRDYFSLGRDPGIVWQTRAWFRSSDDSQTPATFDTRRVLKLLLGHPLWSVQEAAASVLSWLVEEGSLEKEAVRELFGADEPWRVRFGAVEAAYQLRDVDADLFDEAVTRFYNDKVCRLRSLCAENLIASILNGGRREREALIERYRHCLEFWLMDDDCFVLEHLYRLFSRLAPTHPSLATLGSEPTNPLLQGERTWWQLERDSFLARIDAAKTKVVEFDQRMFVEA